MTDNTELIARLRNRPVMSQFASGANLYDHMSALMIEAADALQAIEPKGLERKPMTEEQAHSVLAALLIARRYVLSNPEQHAPVAYAINIVKAHHGIKE